MRTTLSAGVEDFFAVIFLSGRLLTPGWLLNLSGVELLLLLVLLSIVLCVLLILVLLPLVLLPLVFVCDDVLSDCLVITGSVDLSAVPELSVVPDLSVPDLSAVREFVVSFDGTLDGFFSCPVCGCWIP